MKIKLIQLMILALLIIPTSSAGLFTRDILYSPNFYQFNETNATSMYDTRYLMLNASNDPITGDLEIEGNLDIPTTTSTVGQIKQNGNNLIHTYGTKNFFMGEGAGNFVTSGIGGNAAVGTNALDAITTGYWNLALGEDALGKTTSGYRNVAIGKGALSSNINGDDNLAIGYEALKSSNYNGQGSNTAVGRWGLQATTDGKENTAIGFQNSFSNVHGDRNTNIGANVAYRLTSGSRNVGIGFWTLRHSATGDLTNIEDSVFIGAESKALNSAGDTNEIVIGVDAIGHGSNTVTLGNENTIGNYLTGDLNVTRNITGNIHYAEMWGTDIGEVNLASLGVYNNVSNITNFKLNGFTGSSGVLTAQKAGIYAINSQYAFSGQPNNEYHLALAVNGVRVPNCHTERLIGSGGDVGSASITCLCPMDVNDNITIAIENVNSTVNPTVHDINLNMMRIGT